MSYSYRQDLLGIIQLFFDSLTLFRFSAFCVLFWVISVSKNKPDLNKQLHHFNTFLTL